jgi:hypothetical protein
MIIQFNWYEISQISYIPESQLILAYCLFINTLNPHERKIARSVGDLKRKLKIDNISTSLISRNYILHHIRNGIISNYTCAEPQGYFTNVTFFSADVHVKHKTHYLYILSQRPISSKENWIPSYYVDDKYHKNPFITKINDKLYFTLEKKI